ncbi:unnamed protein product [marine sediment metagenome]|uniref:Uncharacterized protein n=1 Tax=marine sediment metagenome TaxID=412755 RepID=X1VEG6_9ZZZZ
MDITAPVTDYVRASLLTTQGDLVKHDGAAAAVFPVGNSGQMLRVNSGGNDLEYILPGAWLFEGEYSAKNAGNVTITTSNVTILTLDLGSVYINGRYSINAHLLLNKGAVSGFCHFRCLKKSGTGVIECFHDKTRFSLSSYITASMQWGVNLSGIFKVTTEGSLVLHITCSSFGSNGEVIANEGQLYVHRLRITA